jgi:hypothetical protein
MIAARTVPIWESEARSAKAQRIVETIDAAFDLARITLPEARLDSVAGMGAAGWAAAAACAGTNLPSDATREVVIACYRRRVRASFDAQVAQALAQALRATVTP